jgi:hypothetical protein
MMGWEEVGMLGAWTWGVHPDVGRPEFREMVISAVRERVAEVGHTGAESVEDWLPRLEQTCSAN